LNWIREYIHSEDADKTEKSVSVFLHLGQVKRNFVPLDEKEKKMVKYIIKRLAIGVFTLFVLVTVTFFLTRLMPGNPFATGNISSNVLEQKV
jgi:hypothetical protein